MPPTRKTQKNERMRIEYFALDDVARWPRNPKLHADAALDESLERFGFVAPAIRDEKSKRLVAGHGRLERLVARKAANEKPPERIEVDANGAWLMPVVCGIAFENEDEAEAYLLADNRLVELGGWSRELPEMLERMKGKPFKLKGLGFGDADIAELKAKLGPAGSTPGLGTDIPEGRYREQYGVIVICADAKEQERVFERLKAEGLKVKVVVT